ncbi:OsmC family protein [Streptomyces liangshanensis]|uniref:OsmC family protein n=1 Tax=Streptomyces liangshanensis TaxID=2717324 RepID=UPI0036D9C5CC
MSVLNGVNTTALRNTVEAIRNDRALGHVTFSVRGDWSGGFRIDSRTGPLTQAGVADAGRDGRYTMAGDEPKALLGTDTAISPAEHLLQALAGCYTVTLTANAAARGIELRAFQVRLESDFDLSGFLGVDPRIAPGAQHIRATVSVDAPEATPEELQELIELVERWSPIRDTLARQVEVTTRLAPYTGTDAVGSPDAADASEDPRR